MSSLRIKPLSLSRDPSLESKKRESYLGKEEEPLSPFSDSLEFKNPQSLSRCSSIESWVLGSLFESSLSSTPTGVGGTFLFPPASPVSPGSIKARLKRIVSEDLNLLESYPIEDVKDVLISHSQKMNSNITQILNRDQGDDPIYLGLVHNLRGILQNITSHLEIEEINGLDQNYQNLNSAIEKIPNSPNEATQIEVDLASFSPKTLMDQVNSKMSALARAKGIELHFWIPESCPDLIGDIHLLEMILNNFVSNAIKYTTGTKINVKIEIVEEGVRLSVQDFGPGISKEDQTKLFFSGIRLESHQDSKGLDSSGIGLGFCKYLAELMNGTIGVKSEEGEGSEFWCAIPFQKAEPIQPMPQVELKRKDLRILLADDSDITRKMMKKQLSKAGAEVTCVKTGESAVTQIKEAETMFDCVLLDMNMPELNGDDAAVQIMQIARERFKLAPAVLILSGEPEESVHRRLQEKGLEGEITVLSKPIRRNQLLTAINQKV